MSVEHPDHGPRFPDGKPADEQPAWRDDFPIDWPEDHYVARRDYTKFLVLTSLAFAVGQLWIGVKSLLRRGRQQAPARAEIARLADVPVGGVRSSGTRARRTPACCCGPTSGRSSPTASNAPTSRAPSCRASSAGNCTAPATSAPSTWRPGRPIAGPPRRPLPRIALEVRDGIIYATGVEERTT